MYHYLLLQGSYLSDQHQDDQCVHDAAQVLQPSLPPGVPHDPRGTVPSRRGANPRLWEGDAARPTAAGSHQGWSQGEAVCLA